MDTQSRWEIAPLIAAVEGRHDADPAPLDALIDALGARFDRSTRIDILAALCFDLFQEDSVTLVRHLMNGDDAVRELIVGVLPFLRYGIDLVPALTSCIEQGNLQQRRLLIDCLIEHKLAHDQDLRPLAALLGNANDTDMAVRAVAVEALGWTRAFTAADAIRRAATDPEGEVRKAAAWGLGRLKDPQDTERLVGLLADPAVAVRAQAANALDELQDRRAVGALRAALDDPHPAVRRRVASALRRTGGPEYDSKQALGDSQSLPMPTDGQRIDVLPPALRQVVEHALAAMRAHPKHHLLPLLRRPIYDNFGSRFDPVASLGRSQLGIWAAYRVLPLWERAEPRNDEPHTSIVLAQERMAGIAMRGEMQDWGAQYSGGPGPHPDEIGWQAVFALDAATRALAEAEGWNALDVIEEAVRLNNHPDVPDVYHHTDEHDPLDAAGEAAMAEACDAASNSRQAEPDKLRAFWEWWLTIAVPAAWAGYH